MKRKITITVALVGTYAFLVWWLTYYPPITDVIAQSAAVDLVNPGLEGEYLPWPGENEVKLPDGWGRWWHDDTRRPEYLEGDVTHTGKALKQFTTHDTVDAGILQEVYGVTPGEWYEFKIWAFYQSTPPGNKMAAMACINPWGDTRIEYRTTVCGKEIVGEAGNWIQVSVKAQAWSDKITVAPRFVAEWEFAYSDVFWDDATLELVTTGNTCPTPAPPLTVAPCATGTPVLTPGAQDCATVPEIEELLRGMTWGVR